MQVNPSVLVATLLCSRKKESQTLAPPAMFGLKHPNKALYFNIQTSDPSEFSSIGDLASSNPEVRVDTDVWDWQSSTWWKKPAFDQDQARLVPICIARNMALDRAILGGFDWVFFVDADVVPPSDSIEKLLAHDYPLVSGLVPGRGAHSGVQYVFHLKEYVTPTLVSCAHATCGFTLIRRDLFEVLRFRQGPHPVRRDVHLSEDPAFGADASIVWEIADKGWLVDLTLQAAHLDAGKPLTWEEAAQF